jgi:hypothetical protein
MMSVVLISVKMLYVNMLSVALMIIIVVKWVSFHCK